MSKNNKNKAPEPIVDFKRWEVIDRMPPLQALWDISTGKRYLRSKLVAIYSNSGVDYFGYLPSKKIIHDPLTGVHHVVYEEQIYTPFIRKAGDYRVCTIMKDAIPNSQEKAK